MSDRVAPPLAVVTGACGGMGSACCRVLGGRYRLALADVSSERLDAQAQLLRQEGFDVALAQTADLSDPDAVAALAAAVAEAGRLGVLVHTAGLSPALAGWQDITLTNLRGTRLVLDAFLPLAREGTVAVCIASMGGHTAPEDPDLDAVIGDPLADDLLERLEPLLARHGSPDAPGGLGVPAYNASKRAVLQMVERGVGRWARQGARIVSVSPGFTSTGMGRAELELGAGGLLQLTPLGRPGTAMDIAAAVAFLCSDAAAFITGCDLRVDGGLTPTFRKVMAKMAAGSAA